MPKRKTFSDNEDDEIEIISVKKNKKKPKIVFEDCPPVKSIKDLITIGKTNKFYKNIDMLVLWDILPYLEELDNMIGMESVKESIFYQLIYYLQNMHMQNRNQEYLHMCITGSPGSGKCLAKDTPVILHNGKIKMVQDINIGELLMGDDSTSRKVLSLARGQDEMYEIIPDKGDSYTVNQVHILCLKMDGYPKIKHNKNRITYKVNWIENNEFKNKSFIYKREIEEDKILKEKDAINFLNTIKQEQIIEIEVKDYLKLPKNIQRKLKTYKVPVEFSDKVISIDPYIVGCWIGNDISSKIKTLDKNLINTNNNIPDIYKYNSRKNRLKFLAGLIDSSGKLHNNCFMFYYKIEKENLFNDIMYLCRSLGFFCYKDKKNNKDVIILKIDFKDLDKIPTKIFKLQPNSRNIVKDVLSSNIKVKHVGRDEYYGFTIDGNRRFLLGDFTVTHNTTLAKILGNIYKYMDILSKKGSFTIAGRDNLIGQYLGETAIKTKKLLTSCLGGVLFIDEAYSLGPGTKDKDSYSKECVDTLCGFLSEHKNDLCCIIAGYEEEIKKCFFSINPGLERRFPWIHKIEEYKSHDMTKIFIKMINEINWKIEPEIDDKYLDNFFNENKEYFKNFGGSIETFISKCKMTHAKRVFSIDKEFKFILTKEDFKNALEMIKQNNFNKKREVVYDYYI